ncbi:ubiquinone/menaquinone biosynthesis methyltransferase [Flexivirga endophytica]|uniref:Ubiquinone/menaquinone biosynthesis methyltransferase n=1 Tax=Flexivirga endophytica TaxID=1849103 RepID=A0A916TJ81_9MICO|nr:class I SAM-dependent methyltransferase [Flexivirga endophytica]GGB47674.1 ubiquinone/menaquinone biosynthesis methyltransferase [Flexivirga endophytica]GHB60585.1 ubiquinone/menaquinone biosynthesis methyltransferase [Flexivirga endophytica]
MAEGGAAFVGSIPTTYERLLVPLIFAEPARHLAATVLATHPRDILETCAGTGVLTRQLVAEGDAYITATDLSAPMLRTALSLCGSDRVTWQVADAMDLPFGPGSFDVVACQFGAMFFPDKPRGYAEALRVLRPGGSLVFSVWDRIEESPSWQIVDAAINAVAGDVPVRFLRRAPYSYFDRDLIRRHLEIAGFGDVAIENLTGTSRSTPEETAEAICQGTPLRMALATHPTLSVQQATQHATRALRDAYGVGPFEAPIGWLQISAGSAS